MTVAVFHDFPGLENGLTKFHDFPGRVVTLYQLTYNHCTQLQMTKSHTHLFIHITEDVKKHANKK